MGNTVSLSSNELQALSHGFFKAVVDNDPSILLSESFLNAIPHENPPFDTPDNQFLPLKNAALKHDPRLLRYSDNPAFWGHYFAEVRLKLNAFPDSTDQLLKDGGNPLQTSDEEDRITLLTIPECFVYSKIGNRPTAQGYRAFDWGLGEPFATGTLYVCSKGSKSVELSVQAPDTSGGKRLVFRNAFDVVDSKNEFINLSQFLEPAIDSSRYFVLRLQRPGHPTAPLYIGIGFRDRSSAFDLRGCLADYQSSVLRALRAPNELSMDAEVSANDNTSRYAKDTPSDNIQSSLSQDAPKFLTNELQKMGISNNDVITLRIPGSAPPSRTPVVGENGLFKQNDNSSSTVIQESSSSIASGALATEDIEWGDFQ